MIFPLFSGGKLVDPTPEIQKEKQSELDRVARQFGGGGGVDMTKFPDFKFPGIVYGFFTLRELKWAIQ